MAKKIGRPTLYNQSYNERVYRYALLGMTDNEIAGLLGIHVDTLYEWKNKYIDFSESIRSGKDEADALVVESLYKRARGYTYKEVKKTKRQIGTDAPIVSIEESIKEVPPDPKAQIYWLNNRQRGRWRSTWDLPRDDISDQGGLVILTAMPGEGIDDWEKRLIVQQEELKSK